MLRTRILTSLVLGPVLLAALYLLPPWGFSALMAGLFAIGAWEYSRLCGFQRSDFRLIYWAAQITLLLLLAWALYRLGWFGTSAAVRLALLLFAANWLIAIIRLGGFGRADYSGGIRLVLNIVQTLLAISGVWFALTWLAFLPQGAWWVLLLLLIIWSADVGAYFSGKYFGRHKLAPAISPGKTWEGVAGAVLLTPLVAWLALELMPIGPLPPMQLIFLAVLVVAVSIGGDLFVSMLKRIEGVKDAGNIFPGHGGVLDRFDSLHAGAPFFALTLSYLAG